MLRSLRIRNLAVIDSLSIEFRHSFTVLTGETGAGKSILVEAVGLLLGGRSSADLVRTGEHQATIEAVFHDGDEEILVRREISSSGRSRAFVNGALATAAALRDLSRTMVELHGQHEHQALLDPLTHVPLLDEYAGLEPLAAEVAREWQAVASLREELDRAGMDVREREARLELVEFQLAEIGRVEPTAGEDDALAATKQILANADRIQRLCADSFADLYERDGAALASLARVWKRVGELAAVDAVFEPYAAAGDGIKSQLEDLAWFVRDYGDRIDASPERLQQVEERLAALERLKKKYGGTLDEVIRRRDALAQERGWLQRTGEQTGDVQARLEEASGRYLDRARVLSQGRRLAATRLASQLQQELAGLAMQDTRVELRFNAGEPPASEWAPSGLDRAELFLSPNPGEDLRPLARIISGGELSRVMLALKTLAAKARADEGSRTERSRRTLIFDEVDAGISGRVADVVGAKLQGLGERFQVLCITHLPQIAARATEQFRITKSVRDGRTVTAVRRLDDDLRVEELARMMGGEVVTDPLRSGARELLLRARESAANGAKGALEAKAKGESESPPEGESASVRPRRRGTGR